MQEKGEMQVADTEREVIDPFKHLMKNHDDNMQSASAASGEKKVRRRFKISHVIYLCILNVGFVRFGYPIELRFMSLDR